MTYNRKTVTIPTKATLYVKPTLVSPTRNNVFNSSGKNVAVVR